MTLATSNRARIRYMKESVFAETPTSGDVYDARYTGDTLDFNFNTTRSNEIRDDRQTTDLVQTGASAMGGINFELSYAEYDPLLEGFLQGVWDVYGTDGEGTAFTGTFAANSLTAGDAPLGSSAFTSLAPGQWVKIVGSTNPGHNTYVQVSTTVAPTSTTLTFEGTPFLGKTGAGGANVRLQSARLLNGVTETSWTIERGLMDVNQFFTFRGMSPDKLSLKFASGSITSGTLDFMGRGSTRYNATQLVGTNIASKTYDVMNAISGVGNVMEGGAPLAGTFIKTLDLTIGNNLRARDAIGVLGAASVGSGSIDVTGTIEVYLADGTLYDKFVNNLSTSLSLRTVDGDGNGYVIDLPRIKYSGGKVNNGGLNQDVMISLPFTALVHPALGHTVAISRVGAAV